MKKIFISLANKLAGGAVTKLAQLDNSKTIATVKQGVNIVDENMTRFAKVVFWLKAIAALFGLAVVLLIANLIVMLVV